MSSAPNLPPPETAGGWRRSRIACLYVPDFPLAALLRAHPELRGQVLAVADGDGPRASLVAVSPEAAQLGVRSGLSISQARAVAAGLVVHPVSADQQRAAQSALGDVAESFSPRLEDAGAGVVYLDLAGLQSLYPDVPPQPCQPWRGGAGGETRLAHDLAQRAAALGIPARVGIAASKIAAYLAGRDGGGVAVIPAGEEWSFLAQVPVALLQPSAALAATLQRWGIRTVGDLAARPASAVGTRLGREGVALVARARGDDAQPFVPRTTPPRYEESVALDYGIETVEPLLFVVRPLLERLTARLAVRGLVCGDLRLSLRLATRGHDERTVVLAAPCNDVKLLLSLLRVHLEAHPAAAAVAGIALAAVAEKLRAAQLDLFQPSGPAPSRMALTLARLSAICGSDNVGMPMTVNDHRPDAYGLAPFVVGDAPRAAAAAPAGCDSPTALPLVLRVFRPARAVEVFRRRDRPEFVRGAAIAGRVVQLAGPWRHSGDWWTEHGYVRDYYDAQLSDGGVYRLYCDLSSGAWFVAGSYD